MKILNRWFNAKKSNDLKTEHNNTCNHRVDIHHAPKKSNEPCESNELDSFKKNTNKAAASSTIIDQKAIQAIRELQMEGQPDILSKVVKTYLSTTQSKIYELRGISQKNAIKDLQFFAHTIKSSSASVGAMHLSEICKDFEMACKNNTVEDAEHYISAIESEFVKVKSALKKEIISC